MTALTLACALLAAPPEPVEAPRPTQGVTLRYRFTPGERVAYRVEQAATTVAVKGEFRLRTETRSATDQHYEVVSVGTDGTATLRLLIDHARMEVAQDGGSPTVYDSRSPEPAPHQFEKVARAVGVPLAEMKVRADGSVSETRPLLRPEESEAVGGAAGLASDASGAFPVVPARPLTVGEEWGDAFKVRVSVGGRLTREVTLRRRYRLEAVERGEEVVSVKTSLLTPVSDPQMLVQLIQRQFTGTTRFDLAAGRITSRSIASDNTELGWAGDDSSLRVVSRWTERLADGATAVSTR